MIRITSLYWSHTSPMVFCIQHRNFSPKIASHYGSQPSSVVFACIKKTTLWPELKVSIGPTPHLWFFAFNTGTLAPKLQVTMGPSPPVWFCALTTAALSPELIVSMGPRPHLSFCACNAAWLAPELLVCMGLRLTCHFVHAKQGD